MASTLYSAAASAPLQTWLPCIHDSTHCSILDNFNQKGQMHCLDPAEVPWQTWLRLSQHPAQQLCIMHQGSSRGLGWFKLASLRSAAALLAPACTANWWTQGRTSANGNVKLEMVHQLAIDWFVWACILHVPSPPTMASYMWNEKVVARAWPA